MYYGYDMGKNRKACWLYLQQDTLHMQNYWNSR